jgi:hypothetical protein
MRWPSFYRACEKRELIGVSAGWTIAPALLPATFAIVAGLLALGLVYVRRRM